MTAPTDAETQAKRRAALRARQKPTVFDAPEPVISDKAVADMSALASALAGLFPDLEDDPADWATCDEHEATYLIGDACPECAPTETPAQCPHCTTAFDPPIAGGITPHTEYDCGECEGSVCWSCMGASGDCPLCAEAPSLLRAVRSS